MKVYFSSSLRAKKYYLKNFDKIFQTIKDLGHKHTSDFLIKAEANEFYDRKGEQFGRFYKNIIAQIKKADICVFEVSLHSLGIGYCVDLAIQMGKPVILLHVPDSNPVFFKGIKSERVQIHEYQLEDVDHVLKDALEEAKSHIDVRFTFFITPKIVHFLDNVAKKKKIPRAVYIRRLLEEAMKKEKFN
jgi:hypothetical protein